MRPLKRPYRGRPHEALKGCIVIKAFNMPLKDFCKGYLKAFEGLVKEFLETLYNLLKAFERPLNVI